tara:strand:- start:1171 stop:2319 length:1149 start_codon:yes stop_codon:yes gene_type:complete
MRIANVIEESRIGGPQIRNLQVAKALKGNIDITLVFPRKNSKVLKRQCNLLGVKYLSLSLTTIKKGLIGILLYVFFFPYEVVMLAWILKKNNFDLVHVSGGSWQSKGIFAAKLARINVIWELNDTYTPAIVRNIFFLISHLADGFIYASASTKKYYRKLISTKKKSFIIQSPVDVDRFNPGLNYKTDKFIDKAVKEKKIIIGTVANVNPIKDLRLLVNVAKRMSIYSNKAIFIVVGSIYVSQKKYYEYLTCTIKNLAIKNFFFLNTRQDIRSLLKAIDIYVCTSKNESSPLSVWEAMSMEKAIVSTDVGDVKKFVNDGVNGLIVKVGNTNKLAKSIKKLIEKPKLRKKFGKKSRQIAKKKLNIKMCGKLYSVAYRIFSKSYL